MYSQDDPFFGMADADYVYSEEDKSNEAEKYVNFIETTSFLPMEGAAIFYNLIAQLGYADRLITTTSRGLFGKISTPPAYISVPVGNKITMQVPWGCYFIKGISISTHAQWVKNVPYFCLSGTVKEEHLPKIKTLANMLRQFPSIYKGKAFQSSFNFEDMLKSDINFFPLLSEESRKKFTINEKVNRLLDAAVFTPIRSQEKLKEHGIPLKRGILFEGQYGVGKTLAASMLATEAVANGWTFIYVNSVAAFQTAITTLLHSSFMPAVLFCEDIDRIITGKRTASMDIILNAMDGLDSKEHELMMVFSSNDVSSINKTFLRPGRIDTIISFELPDNASIEKLIRSYSGGSLRPDTDLTDIVHAIKLKGISPAVIREIVSLAQLTKISQGTDMNLSVDDMLSALLSMDKHIQLME